MIWSAEYIFLVMTVCVTVTSAIFLLVQPDKSALRQGLKYAAPGVIFFQASLLVLFSDAHHVWHGLANRGALASLALLMPLSVYIVLAWEKSSEQKFSVRERLILFGSWSAGFLFALFAITGKLFALRLTKAGDAVVLPGPYSQAAIISCIIACVLILSVIERKLNLVARGSLVWVAALIFAAIFAFLIISASQILMVGALSRYLIVCIAATVSAAYALTLVQRGNFPGKAELSLNKRETVYSSFMVLTIGAYLIFIGVIGKIIAMFGGNVGTFFSVLTGGTAAILLFIIFFSSSLQLRVRRFVDRLFYSGQYDYSEIWSRFAQETAFVRSLEELHNSMLDTISAILGASGGAVYLTQPGSDHLLLAKKKTSNYSRFSHCYKTLFLIGCGDWGSLCR